MASLCARGIITPALAPMQPFSTKSIRRKEFLLGTHLLRLGQERQLWIKCLVYKGRTHRVGFEPTTFWITSQEHEPLHHSAPRKWHFHSPHCRPSWVCWASWGRGWAWIGTPWGAGHWPEGPPPTRFFLLWSTEMPMVGANFLWIPAAWEHWITEVVIFISIIQWNPRFIELRCNNTFS